MTKPRCSSHASLSVGGLTPPCCNIQHQQQRCTHQTAATRARWLLQNDTNVHTYIHRTVASASVYMDTVMAYKHINSEHTHTHTHPSSVGHLHHTSLQAPRSRNNAVHCSMHPTRSARAQLLPISTLLSQQLHRVWLAPRRHLMLPLMLPLMLLMITTRRPRPPGPCCT